MFEPRGKSFRCQILHEPLLSPCMFEPLGQISPLPKSARTTFESMHKCAAVKSPLDTQTDSSSGNSNGIGQQSLAARVYVVRIQQKNPKRGASGLNSKSGRRDSNPRHQPWQGCALPLSYARKSTFRMTRKPFVMNDHNSFVWTDNLRNERKIYNNNA